MKSALYPIGILAKNANVSIQTIRYYERLKLFVPIERKTSKRIRYYNDESLKTLNFIKNAQKHGFQLEEIRHILIFRDKDKLAPGSLYTVAKAKLESVKLEIEKLKHIEALLNNLMLNCDGNAVDCDILVRLESFDDTIR